MPSAFLVHRSEFCAAYRLHNEDFDQAWNERTFGICNSPNFHGHNYDLEVVVRGGVDEDSGMVMDLLKLASLVQLKIISRVDHRNLNTDVDFLEGKIPTTENLASAFWAVLESELPPSVELAEIRLRESRDNQVILKK